MLDITTDDDSGLIEIIVDGRIEREDFERVVAEFERLLATHRQLNVVEVIRDLGGVAPSVWWRDVTWAIGHIHQVSRAAVVTDSGWIGPFARAVGALMPTEIRAFPMSDLAAARLWAAERSDPSVTATPSDS